METLKNEIHTKAPVYLRLLTKVLACVSAENKMRKSYSESHHQMVTSAPPRDGILGCDDNDNDNDDEEREEKPLIITTTTNPSINTRLRPSCC